MSTRLLITRAIVVLFVMATAIAATDDGASSSPAGSAPPTPSANGTYSNNSTAPSAGTADSTTNAALPSTPSPMLPNVPTSAPKASPTPGSGSIQVPAERSQGDDDNTARNRSIIVGLVVTGAFIVGAAAGVVVILRRRTDDPRKTATGTAELAVPRIVTGVELHGEVVQPRPNPTTSLPYPLTAGNSYYFGSSMTTDVAGASAAVPHNFATTVDIDTIRRSPGGGVASHSSSAGDAASVGHSSDSGALSEVPRTRRLQTSRDRVIDETWILSEAEHNSGAFSIPLRCSSGHKVEKCVVVSCSHASKKPKKATDFRTVFDKKFGHIWSCAAHNLQLEGDESELNGLPSPSQAADGVTAAAPRTHGTRRRLAEYRKLTTVVDGVRFSTLLVPNNVIAVYDAIATQLELADSTISSNCTCPEALRLASSAPFGTKQPPPHKIDVTIQMELAFGQSM